MCVLKVGLRYSFFPKIITKITISKGFRRELYEKKAEILLFQMHHTSVRIGNDGSAMPGRQTFSPPSDAQRPFKVGLPVIMF